MERKVQIMQLTLFGQTFFCFVEDKMNLASKTPNAKIRYYTVAIWFL